jgi:exportin-1
MIMKVLKYSEDEAVSQQNQHLLTKLNTTLVSIVKQEWTSSWKNFIPDICSHARESQSRCENVLSILKLLSEEVFDFSKNSMMSTSIAQLKDSMAHEFGVIYELCMWLLQHAISN